MKEVIVMPVWIQEYWIEWLFGIIAACLIGAYRSLQKRVNKEIIEHTAVKNGMRSFLRRQIIADCEDAIIKGYATTRLKDSIDDMYESYHALGGNGVVTQLKNQVMNLPSVMSHEQ